MNKKYTNDNEYELTPFIVLDSSLNTSTTASQELTFNSNYQ